MTRLKMDVGWEIQYMSKFILSLSENFKKLQVQSRSGFSGNIYGGLIHKS
jgi:hypothetical protein